MTRPSNDPGFTLIEVLIALMILSIALIAVAGMFPTGYKQVVDAGRMTLAVTVARQILEDTQMVPFANLMALDNFDSQNPATIPATEPEMSIATRWQADFTAGEGRAVVQVCGDAANPCNPPLPSLNLRQVTVNVTVTALQQNVQLTTLFTGMF